MYLVAVYHHFAFEDATVLQPTGRLAKTQRRPDCTAYRQNRLADINWGRETALPVKVYSIHGAVLAALGEDLDAVCSLGEIDVDLGILAVQFLLAAHKAGAHFEEVLEAPGFEKGLPPDFHAKLGLKQTNDAILCQGGGDPTIALLRLEKRRCREEIILDQ